MQNGSLRGLALGKLSTESTTQLPTDRPRRSRGLTIFSSRENGTGRRHTDRPTSPRDLATRPPGAALVELNPRRLVVEPIRVFCEGPPSTHETVAPRLLFACFRGLPPDSESPGERGTNGLLTFERLSAGAKYEDCPGGLCESQNCEVRKQWVRMLRDNFRPDPDEEQQNEAPRPVLVQILQDLPRTCQDLFGADTAGQARFFKTLCRVLVAYARRDPEVEYVQGMNLVAACIVNHLKEPRLSYRMLEHLMIEHRLNEVYKEGFSELRRHCDEAFHRYAKRISPDIYQHLLAQGVLVA